MRGVTPPPLAKPPEPALCPCCSWLGAASEGGDWTRVWGQLCSMMITVPNSGCARHLHRSCPDQPRGAAMLLLPTKSTIRACRHWPADGLYARLGCLENKIRWVWGFCCLFFVWFFRLFFFSHSQCQQKFSSKFRIRDHITSTSTSPYSWETVYFRLCSF